jgi:hypothetical protein
MSNWPLVADDREYFTSISIMHERNTMALTHAIHAAAAAESKTPCFCLFSNNNLC